MRICLGPTKIQIYQNSRSYPHLDRGEANQISFNLSTADWRNHAISACFQPSIQPMYTTTTTPKPTNFATQSYELAAMIARGFKNNISCNLFLSVYMLQPVNQLVQFENSLVIYDVSFRKYPTVAQIHACHGYD